MLDFVWAINNKTVSEPWQLTPEARQADNRPTNRMSPVLTGIATGVNLLFCLQPIGQFSPLVRTVSLTCRADGLGSRRLHHLELPR